MKKRFAIILPLIALLVLQVSGCTKEAAYVPADMAEEDQKEITVAELKTLEPAVDYSVFNGAYDDEYSQRAYLTAEANPDGNGILIIVDWADSAVSFERWEMNADLEGNKLTYTDCRHERFSSADAPEGETAEVLFAGEQGYFEIDGGKLKWTGASDPDCRECVFSRG